MAVDPWFGLLARSLVPGLPALCGHPPLLGIHEGELFPKIGLEVTVLAVPTWSLDGGLARHVKATVAPAALDHRLSVKSKSTEVQRKAAGGSQRGDG